MIVTEKLMRTPFTFLFGNGVTGVGLLMGNSFRPSEKQV